MGKRSNFKRRKHDKYATPYECVIDLLPHLRPKARFCEPCAGDGALVDHLTRHGFVCASARDIHPRRDDIDKKDALRTLTGNIQYYITNPPWTREILHPLIEVLSDQYPTWLLFDADWAHTKQAIPYLPRCRKIIPIGRVKWIPNSEHVGKDNAAWYLFTRDRFPPTIFFPRAA